MTLVRKQDWPQRLGRFAEGWLGRPFAWGTADCVILCADWVVECTGVDLIADFRGTYTSAREALRALRCKQFEDLPQAVGQRLESAPLDAGRLWRGDVALIECPKAGPGLGLVLGEDVLVMDPALGCTRISRRHVDKGWRV